MFKSSIIVINAPVTIVFSLLSFAVWGLYALGILNPYLPFFILEGSTFKWDNYSDYFSLILYPFMHTSADHLMNNMMYILLLGPMLEERYGFKSFLLMIVSTSLIIGLAFILVKNPPSMGSSGIAFMMIILSSFTHFHLRKIPMSFILIFGLYIVREMIGFGSPDNVSRVGHIVGGLCGAGFGLYQIGRGSAVAQNS